MNKENNILIEATWWIHIGYNFIMSFQASFPFWKIEVYWDKVILVVQSIPNFIIKICEFFWKIMPFLPGTYKKIPKEITLYYKDIKHIKERKLWKFLWYGITFVHTNSNFAPFLQMWLFEKDALQIIKHLNSKKIYNHK